MIALASYIHRIPAEGDTQEADPRPGSYYVSCIYGEKRAFLYGPLPSHAAALAVVDQVRAVAVEVDPYAHFYSFGTARRCGLYAAGGAQCPGRGAGGIMSTRSMIGKVEAGGRLV